MRSEISLAFDEIRVDEYSVATEARDVGAAVIAEYPDVHGHLDPEAIGYLFRDDEVRDHESKVVAASAHLVAQLIAGAGAKYFGRFAKWALLKELGFLPVFLILVDRNIWEGADCHFRKYLIDHELEHCIQKVDADGSLRFNQQTGAPVWGIKPHDIEEFNGAIARHGLVTEDHREFARTIIDRLTLEAEDVESERGAA